MDTIADRWWLLALRGVAAILFGILTFVAPTASLLALILVFGVYALVDGALYISMAIRWGRRGQSWGSLMLAGIAGVAAGVITFLRPGISALALLFLIAAWAVVTGVASLFAAWRLRKVVRGEWLLALSGVLSIVFGILIARYPGAGALAVTMWIGAYAVVFGAILLALGFRLRSLRARGVPSSAFPTPTPA
jgi:uncharacterized membrane protein HdeD (DUF308 family)